jgi:hypothetical protein
MKVDLYTKIVLTVIALALTFNLLKPVLLPSDVAAEEDKKFEHLQISISAVGIYFFDTKTGDLWIYKEQGDIAKYTLTNGIGSPFKRTGQ